MATQDQILQAMADAQNIDKAPASVNYNWRDALTGFSNYPDPVQDVIYPNQLQDESFSDLREDLDSSTLPFPRNTSALNYNIHRDPPRDWREDYQGTYGAPTPDLYSNEPTMMNLKRDGIMGTDQAQKKDGILQNIKNWGTNILDNTMFGKFAAMNNPLNPNAANYNPRLQGQVEDLNKINFLSGSSGQTGPYRITGGPLQNKNLVSMFGTNDYDEMLAKRAAWFQRRKDEDKGFSQKNWDAIIAEQQARGRDIPVTTGVVRPGDGGQGDYQRAPIRSASEAASRGVDVRSTGMMGPGGRHYAQGGYMRSRYNKGGRVGILAAF